MKILYLTDEIPFPPDNGIRIVPYNSMRLMRLAGNEVHLCTLTAESSETEGVLSKRFQGMAGIISSDSWWMQVKRHSVFRQVYETVRGRLTYLSQFDNKGFRKRLKQTIAEIAPDVVHFDFVNMTQYLDCVPEQVGTVASVNDCHTLTLKNRLEATSFSSLQSYVKSKQLKLTERYETITYPQFGVVHLMTKVDAEFLERLNPKIRTWVIPNGVDDSLFDLNRCEVTGNDIVFVGKLFGFNYFSIRQFVEQGWPKIKSVVSGARLRVVGRITQESRQWVEQIRRTERNIVFEGYLEKLRDAYSGAKIAIVPLDKNSGIINKAIEGMAAGAAVVGFAGVFEGMASVVPGRHCMTANSHSELGKEIAALLVDASRCSKMADAGRNLAERQYAWSSKISDYDSMYRMAREIALKNSREKS